MSEIISLQFGQCGNQIGAKFWETICREHLIECNGLLKEINSDVQTKTNVYFHEVEDRRFIPRAILIDLEPGPLDGIRSSKEADLFRPDNYICGRQGAGNNWATGHNTRGASIADTIMDVVRKEAEACDCLQGFSIIHSLGGGTGSGLGTLIMTSIQEEYPDRLMSSVSVLPSQKVSEVVVEPYNSLLSLDQLIESCDAVFCMDNEALYDICSFKLKLKRASYKDLNELIAMATSGVTTSLRFPGQLNSDLRKMAVNMIPYPRLHFFLTGVAPLTNKETAPFYNETVAQITQDLFDPRHLMCACNPSMGRYLTFSAMYRGKVSMKDVDKCLWDIQEKNSSKFVEWIPNNAKVSACNVPPHGHSIGATFIANHTAIQEPFRRIKMQFNKMFKKRAFLHWYIQEGCDLQQFVEADSNISDLMSEYQQYTDATVDEDTVWQCEELEDSLEDHDSGFAI